jgi:protein-disulfide isomerase
MDTSTEKESKTKQASSKKLKSPSLTYVTHWNSFWFGFMTALAIVLFILLIGTVAGYVTFNKLNTNNKSVPISETPDSNSKTDSSTQEIQVKDIDAIAKEFNVNKDELQKCMDERRYKKSIEDDMTSGQAVGVKGTPHSFVLIDNAMYEIPGAYSEEGMREFFDDLLTGKDPRAKDVSKEKTIATVTKDDWVRGSENARITVITYTDVDCPFCKKFHTATTNIMKDYPDTIRWVFRHMPSDNLHPDARAKAEMAECLGELAGPEAFWKYVDTMLQ